MTPSLTQKDGRPPPSPATIHLLPSPDLAQQTSGEEDQRERRENKPSQVEDKPTPSSIPRGRSQGRDRLALRKRRKRTRPGMFAALQRFSPTRLMRKAKMMLRSVKSEWINIILEIIINEHLCKCLLCFVYKRPDLSALICSGALFLVVCLFKARIMFLCKIARDRPSN